MSDEGNGSIIDGDWEYRPLRLPPGVSRKTAMTQLALHAEFSGWELARVLLFADGTRKIWLRRRYRPNQMLPGIIA
ncbi:MULTISPECIES: DUF5703 family protein [Allokutzneria]|uniref:DUF5703 family protein n=1 Tax=Allokutzneria multivorans TaxID=1142134 RepID=A0ABP7SZT4_9PSEU|nr:DUF5703 family protein [Allokutzneria sp. NRRL B-24872]